MAPGERSPAGWRLAAPATDSSTVMRATQPVTHPRARLGRLAALLPVIAALLGSASLSQSLPGDAPAAEPPVLGAENGLWRYIIIHHSASPSGNAAAFTVQHRKQGWDDIGYHFVIDNGHGGPDGRLEVTPRWWQQKHGAHAGRLRAVRNPEEKNRYNEFGIGICLVGNFETAAPTPAQLDTLCQLVTRLRTTFSVPPQNIVGHGNVTSTACPGSRFPWPTLFARLNVAPPALTHARPAGTLERCQWCGMHEQATVSRRAGDGKSE